MVINNEKLYSHMDDASWNELRMAMFHLGDNQPQWRSKEIKDDYLSDWDGEWYYHFRTGGYRTIEYIEIQVSNKKMRDLVRNALIKIPAAGRETKDGFIVLGYTRTTDPVEYITK